ncbi:LysR family transcriptional regulator, partial [Roseovarius marisflavi]|uniref:LysR family transcriptional regulator n=1 Tax=Roseovarius marisflavi TaxID=1054996 RepID=UPI001114B989
MTRRLPSLNQLRAFEAAARHESIKMGADELCVTPAAVGHQIKGLELGLVAFAFRPLNSFMRPFVQKPRGFCRRAMSG